MVLLFVTWMTAYYVVGFLTIMTLPKWRITLPAAALALGMLVATWPAVDYADSSGLVIGIFALIVFVSGVGIGEIVRSTRDELRSLDERARLLEAGIVADVTTPRR